MESAARWLVCKQKWNHIKNFLQLWMVFIDVILEKRENEILMLDL